MTEDKNIIGEVNVTVKAGLSVDRKTAGICMDLLGIYFKQEGAKGAILMFRDDNVEVRVLEDEKTLANAVDASFKHNRNSVEE